MTTMIMSWAAASTACRLCLECDKLSLCSTGHDLPRLAGRLTQADYVAAQPASCNWAIKMAQLLRCSKPGLPCGLLSLLGPLSC